MPKIKNDRRVLHPELKGWRRYYSEHHKVRRIHFQRSMMARGKMAAVGSSDKLRAAGSRSDQTRAWRPAQVRRGQLRRFYEQCIEATECGYFATAIHQGVHERGAIPEPQQTYVVDNARARFYGTLWRKLSGVPA